MLSKIKFLFQQVNVRVQSLLNQTAMYRLVLYVLCGYVAVAFVYSLFDGLGLVPFTPLNLFISLATFLFFSYISNRIFAKLYKAQVNVESVYITALILFCIITPPASGTYISFLSLAITASFLASASKYILAYGKRHIFNPVAIAVVITGFTLHESASWWIGRGDMMPFVLLGGVLITMKIRRMDMAFSFIASALVTITILSLIQGTDPIAMLASSFSDTALLFFAFIMLTEPITTPPTKQLRIAYGILVGVFFAPNFFALGMFGTPEFALVIGNIFSYAVSPKRKYILKLQEKIEVARDTFEYVFTSDSPVAYLPGQYMEWTLSHPRSDTRGNRRYFTLASSPTENSIRLGLRQYKKPSSYKRHLHTLQVGDEIVSAQCSGDFVLPTRSTDKLVFIAGGIGITPFRSMIKYLVDTKDNRDVVLLYANREKVDVAYHTFFEEAKKTIALQTFYFYSEATNLPLEVNEREALISESIIKQIVPDYTERTFFISGPNAMVADFKNLLKTIGIKSAKVKTDYFPGL